MLGEVGPAAADAANLLLDELRRPEFGCGRFVAEKTPEVAAALSRIASERARREGPPLLQKWLRRRAERVEAAVAILRMDPANPEALAALREALRDAQEDQRLEAATALASLGPAAGGVLPALRAGLRDRLPRIRVWAAAAFWRAGGDAEVVLPVLLEGLKSGPPWWFDGRHEAAHLLGEMGQAAARALPALREAAVDADSHLRTEAEIALRKIDPAAAARAGVP